MANCSYGEGPSNRYGKRPRRPAESESSSSEDIPESEEDDESRLIEDYAAEDDGAPGASNGGIRERGESSRDRSIPVTLTDPEVLDCPICCEALTIPIYQCGNGHIACSSCGAKITNKCHSCCLPVAYTRNRALEKVLVSVEVLCQNTKYGCKETISYSKKNQHEQKCLFAPCFCPLPGCDFVGSSNQFYQHFGGDHKKSAVHFENTRIFHVTIKVDERFRVLQEEKDGVVFILHNEVATIGNTVSLSCIAPGDTGVCFQYCIAAKDGFCSSLKYQSRTLSIQKREDKPRVTGSFLLVPSNFIDSKNRIRLEICIWGPTYGLL